VAKVLTTSEAETKRQQAVTFLNRIGKEDDAAKFEAMDAQEYAEHKGAELIDNRGKKRITNMASNKSKANLEAELDEAQDYIEQLESKLDDIAGIAADEDEEEDSSDDSDEDNGNDPD
jgi:hypothetical protein